MEQFEKLSEAAVTAPICPTYTDYLSRGLEEKFGVQFKNRTWFECTIEEMRFSTVSNANSNNSPGIVGTILSSV